MPLDPVAIVPVKGLRDAKARLAHLLGPSQRAALSRRLLDGVVSALHTAGLRVVVLSSQEIEADAEVWLEEAAGLNAALRAALRRTGTPALIVPSDLPRLSAPDVHALLAEHGDVVIVPSADGGTNALLLRRPAEPSFGPRSALRHAALARERGLHARFVRVAGFEEDVDDDRSLRRNATLICAVPTVRGR